MAETSATRNGTPPSAEMRPAPEVHRYVHGHIEEHGHDHAHHDHLRHAHHPEHPHAPADEPRAHATRFSLMALSGGQRLLLSLPLVGLIWLLTLWAIGGG